MVDVPRALKVTEQVPVPPLRGIVQPPAAVATVTVPVGVVPPGYALTTTTWMVTLLPLTDGSGVSVTVVMVLDGPTT